MYNLRYHIASLVAVFLALAVGLLLGTIVAERGMITDQTSSLVADLQRRFDELNATNDDLKLGLERDAAFSEAAVPPLVAGRLSGNSVAILVGTDRADGLEPAMSAVAQAGGSAFTLTVGMPALGLDKAEPEGLAAYFQLRGVEMAPPGEALEKQVAEALVAEWRSGAGSPLMELLVSNGLLGIEGASAAHSASAVIVLGNGEEGCDPFVLEVARAMAAAGGAAVGVESTPVEGGVASVCDSEGLSAVDHIGTPQGRLSLVWLLSGRASGYFGSAPAADAYFPEIEP
ncbi:MAG: copper transporter [Coriobacteriia bacterium]|nr:copper transporter [Coriobacteriia bacterium]